MSKYRIKKIVDGNGDSSFYPQKKVLWWWENIQVVYIPGQNPTSMISYSESSAQEWINKHFIKRTIKYYDV